MSHTALQQAGEKKEYDRSWYFGHRLNSSRMKGFTPSRPVSCSHISPPSRSTIRSRSKKGQHRCSKVMNSAAVRYIAGLMRYRNAYPLDNSLTSTLSAFSSAKSLNVRVRSSGVRSVMTHANGDSLFTMTSSVSQQYLDLQRAGRDATCRLV